MKEIALTIEETNRKAIKLVIPIAVIMAVLFVLLHGYRAFFNWSWIGSVVFVGSVLSGIFIHELLHALVLGLFVRGGFSSIKFGFDRNTFTPYCHCTKPIRVRWYRLGAIMPLILQGILPFVVSLFTGSLGWWAFGVLFTVGAGGDLLAIEMLSGLRSRARVLDHPEKMGFYLLEECHKKDNRPLVS